MRRLREEDGMSVVELTLTIGIFAAIMAFTFTAITSAWTSANGVERRLQDLAEAREIVNNLSKDLRTAISLQSGTAPFTEAEDFVAEFYANLNPTSGPRRIRLYVDGSNRMVQEITEPDVTSTPPLYTYTGAPSVRILGESVSNQPTDPVFLYYDGSGTALPTPLSAPDMLRVEAVGISLSVKSSPNTSIKPTTVVNRVRLANVIYGAA
jgi:hypothetical protein